MILLKKKWKYIVLVILIVFISVSAYKIIRQEIIQSRLDIAGAEAFDLEVGNFEHNINKFNSMDINKWVPAEEVFYLEHLSLDYENGYRCYISKKSNDMIVVGLSNLEAKDLPVPDSITSVADEENGEAIILFVETEVNDRVINGIVVRRLLNQN